MSEKCRVGHLAIAGLGKARAWVVLKEMVAATDSRQSGSRAARLNSSRAGKTALAARVALCVLVTAFARLTFHPEAGTLSC